MTLQTVPILIFGLLLLPGCGLKIHMIGPAATNAVTPLIPPPLNLGPAPSLTWSPLARDYGNVATGQQSGTFTYMLFNAGPGDAICTAGVTLSDPVNYTVISPGCSGTTLAAGASCSLTVRATPASAGAFPLSIGKSCQQAGTVSASAMLISAVPAPSLAWSTATVDFGPVRLLGVSPEISVQLFNIGTASASCSSPYFSAGDITQFTLTDVNCANNPLPINSYCTVKVRANPDGSMPSYGYSSTLTRTCGGLPISTNVNAANGGTPQTLLMSSTAGVNHSCTVMADNTVKCWGDNGYGQLGWGSGYNPGSNAVFVKDMANTPNGKLTAITKVSAGAYHSCAIDTGKNLYCWGRNSNGQLGDGTTLNRNFPIQVLASAGTPLAAVDEVSAGADHTCVRIGTNIQCWGSQANGRLGNGITTGNAIYPVSIPVLINVTQISAGASHTCALISDGTVQCWGDGTSGKLGDGTASQRSSPVTVLSAAGQVSLTGVAQVVVASGHTCALMIAQTIKCWGEAISNGDSINHNMADYSVPGLASVTLLASSGGGYQGNDGISTTCALISGRLSCWGTNKAGQFKNGSYVDSMTPTLITGLVDNTVSRVGVFQDHVCVSRTDNSIGCWGTLGVPMVTPPQEFIQLAGATQVVSSGGHACALFPGSPPIVKCWGDGKFGKLGDGTTLSREQPVAVSFPGSPTIIQLSLGPYHTCALSQAGEVYCWGNGQSGQTGTGGPTYSLLTPTQISPADLSGVIQISVGNGHSCALLSDKTVKCWGDNSLGQIGQGFTGLPVYIPTRVLSDLTPTSLPGVIEISAGDAFVCARLNSGKVKCWGDNGSGQIGNNTSGVPVPLPAFVQTGASPVNLTQVTALSSGVASNCALLSNNQVACWGQNVFGQLGNGGGPDSPLAILLNGLVGVTELYSGEHYSCALVGNSDVKCWGRNSQGQMGGGSGGATPGKVPGLSNTASLQHARGTFGNTAFILTNDSKTICWGNDTFQLAGGNEMLIQPLGGI